MKAGKRIVLALAFLAVASGAQAHEMPATHGMLVFGQKQVYLSHLPMFHSPHDYQVIVAAEISPAAKAAYLDDQSLHPEVTVYTLVPEDFLLPEMIRHPKPFHADLYRGHFERGGTVIARQIEVRITQVVHFHQFDPQAQHPSAPEY